MDEKYNKYNKLIETIPQNKLVISENFENVLSQNLNNFNLKLKDTIDNVISDKIDALQSEFAKIALNEFKNYMTGFNDVEDV